MFRRLKSGECFMKKKNFYLIILGSVSVLILVFFVLFFLYKKNLNNKDITILTINGERSNENVIVDANSRQYYVLLYNNKNSNPINYGAYYKIVSDNVNKTAFTAYDISNDKNKYDSIMGSSNKKVIHLLVEVVNSSNKNITINFGVKTSDLDITYNDNEYAIGKEMVNLANEPNIKDGLIPIYYDEFNGVWKKADQYNNDNNWYNYETKKWANAVIVKENLKDKYLKMDVNSVISEDDILGYFVWIPRFSYRLFNNSFDYLSVQEINVFLELKSDAKSAGDNNGQWLTHPAFTFGNEELSGIWVGKFETTGNAANPTVKPNLNPLVNQKVSEQFNSSLKFSSYMNSDVVDSHMAKNTEWGAIAYFTYSKYGKCIDGVCSDIRNNNVNTLASGHGVSITGCSSSVQNGDMVISNVCSTDKSKPYNDIKDGVLASTTGSIYGIYDMNGGSWEVTMGVLTNEDGTGIYTGFDSIYNSGYTGIFDNNEMYEGVNLPDKKYYDAYSYHYKDDSYYIDLYLGDATGETKFMNIDFLEFVWFDYPWFMRGGTYFQNENSGVFAFAGTGGSEFSNIKTFRTILAYTK